MNESLIIFLISGLVSMSAALSGGALNKQTDQEKPSWLRSDRARVSVIFAGNYAALTLVGAMAFGFLNEQIHWSIPLSSIFLTFPLIHILFIQKLLGDARALLLMMPVVIACSVILYVNWP